jgi:hypothetical protein
MKIGSSDKRREEGGERRTRSAIAFKAQWRVHNTQECGSFLL